MTLRSCVRGVALCLGLFGFAERAEACPEIGKFALGADYYSVEIEDSYGSSDCTVTVRAQAPLPLLVNGLQGGQTQFVSPIRLRMLRPGEYVAQFDVRSYIERLVFRIQ